MGGAFVLVGAGIGAGLVVVHNTLFHVNSIAAELILKLCISMSGLICPDPPSLCLIPSYLIFRHILMTSLCK